MKKLFFVACAAVALMMASCGGTKTENVSGDLKKDAAKYVEIMNKGGEATNEDSKILDEIAAYYEAEGKGEEFTKEFQDQFSKVLTGEFNKAVDESMNNAKDALNDVAKEGAEAIKDAAK